MAKSEMAEQRRELLESYRLILGRGPNWLNKLYIHVMGYCDLYPTL